MLKIDFHRMKLLECPEKKVRTEGMFPLRPGHFMERPRGFIPTRR